MSAVMGSEKIVGEIDAHIKQEGSGYSQWYCGIASDPKERLFNDHNVSEKNGWWIFRDAGSDDGARRVEDYFIRKGCKGGGGGGDSGTRHVYAYRITSTTRE